VGVQVKLCDPSLTHAVPECFRDVFLVIKHYTDLPLLCFYFTLLSVVNFCLCVLCAGRLLFEGVCRGCRSNTEVFAW